MRVVARRLNCHETRPADDEGRPPAETDNVPKCERFNMQKDDLTPAANHLIESAQSILDVLRVDIGSACRKYPNENAFLEGTISFLDGIIERPDKYLEKWDYLESVPHDKFAADVRQLRKQFVKILAPQRAEPDDRTKRR